MQEINSDIILNQGSDTSDLVYHEKHPRGIVIFLIKFLNFKNITKNLGENS